VRNGDPEMKHSFISQEGDLGHFLVYCGI